MTTIKNIGLDSKGNRIEEVWISTDALILYGCVHCMGFESEKSVVFHRVVAPEYQDVVTITDRDLRKSLHFLITAATILEQMTRDILADPSAPVNYKKYQKKVRKYRPTLEGMMERFQDDVFGAFYNRRPRETFIELLATDGWKYFSLKNLNTLFSIMLQEHGTTEISQSTQQDQEEVVPI